MKPDDVIMDIAERVTRLACSKCGKTLAVADLPMFSEIECPDCHTRQTIPARLKNFLIMDILGVGGMAGVYRAYDQSLGRLVAIKIMRKELGEDPKFVENFLREARSAAQLNHRNIVSIYMVDATHGQPFIVMELLDGGRLDEWITKGEPIPERRILQVAHDVAEGLQAATQIGLVHGDIKPANILFNRAGIAKVADFGIARFQARNKISKGEIWGTPYYIAPEKVQGGKEDLRSDIYSLGGTLFHALCLKPPYDGPTATDVVLARIKTPPPSISELREDLHPETVALIARMLEQDPFRRYPTYTSLLSDIEEAQRAVEQSPPAFQNRKKPEAEIGQTRSRKWMLLAGGGALLAILVAVGLWLALRKPTAEPAPVEPVAAVEPGETNAPSTGTNAPPVEPVPAAPLYPLQPFNAEEQKFLVQAGEWMATGKVEEAEAKLREMATAIPMDHPGRPWIPVFLAIPSWVDQNTTQTVIRIKRLCDATYANQADGSVHPGFLAQSFGRILIGETNSLPAPAGGGEWPEWVGDLLSFFSAYKDLHTKGELEKLPDMLDAYAQKAVPADPVWPYALQPLARKWKADVETYFTKAAERAARKDHPERVLADLVKQRKVAAPAFVPYLDREIAMFTERVRVQQAEVARLAALEKLQLELDRLDEARAETLPFFSRYDFDGAGKAFESKARDCVEPDAKRYAEQVAEGLRLMRDLKQFVMESFKTAPFRQGARELGGEVISATDQTLVIRIGGVGQTERPWTTVSPATFVQMAETYLAALRTDPGQASDLYLATSLYVYSMGGYPRATAYAQRARSLNPANEARIRRLMPGVLPD